MGTVSQLHERSRPPAHRIGDEDEALTIALSLAEDFRRKAAERDLERIFPLAELDALAASGLLGVTAPAEVHGIDIANGVLAEILAALAEADSSIAEVYAAHLRLLEHLRWQGDAEQQAAFFGHALNGDIFALVSSEQTGFSLMAYGAGLRAEGREKASAGALFADWIGLAAQEAGGSSGLLLIPRQREGVRVIDDWDSLGQRTAGGGTVILQNAVAEADAIMPLHRPDSTNTIRPLADLLHAAIDLGIARAAFSEIRPASAGAALFEGASTARLGELSVKLEAVTAMIERAARKLDIAQVNADAQTVAEAVHSVLATRAASAATVLDAANAVFDFGADVSDQGANLDRHWRNARARAGPGPARQYEMIGRRLAE